MTSPAFQSIGSINGRRCITITFELTVTITKFFGHFHIRFKVNLKFTVLMNLADFQCFYRLLKIQMIYIDISFRKFQSDS